MTNRRATAVAAALVIVLVEWAGGAALRADPEAWEECLERHTREKCCRKAFKEGVRQYDRREWEKVRQPMLGALHEECPVPTESVIVPYGRWRYKYVPAAYLGTAIGFHEDDHLREAVKECNELAASDRGPELEDGCAQRIRSQVPEEADSATSGDHREKAAVWWQCMAGQRRSEQISGLVERSHCSEIVSIFTQVFLPGKDPRITLCEAMFDHLQVCTGRLDSTP